MRGHSKDNEECTCAYGQFSWDDKANLDCPVNFDGQVSSVAFSVDGSKFAVAFIVYDDDYDFRNGGVKICSSQGSAGFVCQSTLTAPLFWSSRCVAMSLVLFPAPMHPVVRLISFLSHC